VTNVNTPNMQRDAHSQNGRPRVFVAGETEARPGIMTTEFWLTIVSAMTVVIAAYISDSFETDLGWALFAGIIAAYLISRGLAKAGSREGPFVLGDRGEINAQR
jgi:hypothetical protein